MHPSRLVRRAERINATLFLPGVICILAGLVGGGLKAAGVDIPVLKTWGGQAVFVGLGLLLVLLSFFVGVGAKPEEWVRPARGFAGRRPFLGRVPSPPERFVARPAEFGCIRMAMLQRRPRVGVVGMGGAGKSALAAAVAHDGTVAKRFRRGIAWIDVRGDRSGAQLQQLQRQLAVLLGDRDSAFTTVEQWRDHLAWLLADRTCLVILDNIWDRAVLDAFDLPRTNSTILFTTRDHRLVDAAGAVECGVDTLDIDQARALLARWTSTDQLPSQADQICAEVGNLALGVAMAGAMIPKLGWDHVLHRLGSADLDRIRADFPDYPHPTLLAAIEISISTLPFNAQERYRELAVFAGQGPVPEAAIAALWAADGVAVEDVRDLLADYADRSLAWRHPDGTISLHDLHLDVATVQLQQNVGGMRRAHRRLLDGYRARCSNGWASGPNDGYFYQHLLHHLAHADLEHDRQKLLVDFDWLYAKLGATDITAVLADYSDLGQGEATVTVQETLQLAAPALAHDARQLPAQLVGRLDDQHDPAVRALVAQARRFDASPWLCPVTPTSFHRPGGPLKRVFPHPAAQWPTATAICYASATTSRFLARSSSPRYVSPDPADGRPTGSATAASSTSERSSSSPDRSSRRLRPPTLS